MGNAATEQFEKNNILCPIKFRHSLFTMGAIDNTDVDTSSATAMSSFHGTVASLLQKVPQKDAGEKRNITTEFTNNKKLKKLPNYYTDIPAAYLPPKIKMTEATKILVKTSSANEMEDDKEWLTFVRNESLNVQNAKNVSWAALHVTHTERSPICADFSALLPMWRESSKSPAMLKHSMMVIAKAIEFLNPGQTPMITFDQPLCAISKQLQWNFTNQCGQERFVIMLGPLHTEMAFLSVLGDLVEGTRWTTVVQNESITRPGVAQALLTGHDVVRTKYVHQVTARCLDILMHEAFQQRNIADASQQWDFIFWQRHMEDKNPTFKYWSLVLDME